MAPTIVEESLAGEEGAGLCWCWWTNHGAEEGGNTCWRADVVVVLCRLQAAGFFTARLCTKRIMAATVATPVTPTEFESDRCVSEEEGRGNEAEEEGGQLTGPVTAVAHSRLSKLPLARIKALMKTDPDVSLASQESVFIIAKATVSRGSAEDKPMLPSAGSSSGC